MAYPSHRTAYWRGAGAGSTIHTRAARYDLPADRAGARAERGALSPPHRTPRAPRAVPPRAAAMPHTISHHAHKQTAPSKMQPSCSSTCTHACAAQSGSLSGPHPAPLGTPRLQPIAIIGLERPFAPYFAPRASRQLRNSHPRDPRGLGSLLPRP